MKNGTSNVVVVVSILNALAVALSLPPEREVRPTSAGARAGAARALP